jgi:hypothetical protein
VGRIFFLQFFPEYPEKFPKEIADGPGFGQNFRRTEDLKTGSTKKLPEDHLGERPAAQRIRSLPTESQKKFRKG